jgi:hypothetical protein
MFREGDYVRIISYSFLLGPWLNKVGRIQAIHSGVIKPWLEVAIRQGNGITRIVTYEEELESFIPPNIEGEE